MPIPISMKSAYLPGFSSIDFSPAPMATTPSRIITTQMISGVTGTTWGKPTHGAKVPLEDVSVLKNPIKTEKKMVLIPMKSRPTPCMITP